MGARRDGADTSSRFNGIGQSKREDEVVDTVHREEQRLQGLSGYRIGVGAAGVRMNRSRRHYAPP